MRAPSFIIETLRIVAMAPHSPTRTRGAGGIEPASVWSVYFYTPPGCERGIDQLSLWLIQKKCREHHQPSNHSRPRDVRLYADENHQRRALSKTNLRSSTMCVCIASNQEARTDDGRPRQGDSHRASVRIHKCQAQRACLSPTQLCQPRVDLPLLAAHRAVPIWSMSNEPR